MTSEAGEIQSRRGRATEGVLRDLADQTVMQFAAGERLWKLYIFRPARGQATRLEHRIYTKVKPDGRLALVTFAVHAPEPGQPVRSAIARVPEITPEALDRIIEAIRRETRTQPDEFEQIDLTGFSDLAGQMAYLAGA